MRSGEVVPLKGGLVVPAEVLVGCLEMETRGISFTSRGSELLVGPHALLTDADRAFLRRWRSHVAALAEYHVPSDEAIAERQRRDVATVPWRRWYGWD